MKTSPYFSEGFTAAQKYIGEESAAMPTNPYPIGDEFSAFNGWAQGFAQGMREGVNTNFELGEVE